MPDAKDDLKKKVTLEDIERLDCEERDADTKHGRLLDGASPPGTRRLHEAGDSPKNDPLRRHEDGDSPKKDPLRRKEPDDPIGGRLLDGDPKRPRRDD
jgi:hypothetical protein